MSKITANPYIFFKGNCREAMEFYQGIFGGDLEVLDYESTGQDVPDMAKTDVMHAYLSGGDIILMGSDTTAASEKAAKIGLSIGGDDETRLTQIFNALAVGGTVQSPLKKEFWGDIFGNLEDKYGIEWLVTISKPADS